MAQKKPAEVSRSRPIRAADKGMPNWSGKLSADDVEAVRAYIADRAKQLKADEDAAKRVSAK